MEKAIVVADFSKPRVNKAVTDVLPWLKQQMRVVVDKNLSMDLEQAEADVILVFGGDGSILATSRRLGSKQTPILGVNAGHLGFMTGVSPNQFRSHVKLMLAGDYLISPRMMLSCRLRRKGKEKNYLALNDAVLERSGQSRMLNIDVWVNREYLTTYAGDGLVVATATGSTAHSLAAGGPILHSSMEGFVLSPLAPHTLTNRPMVLPGDVCLEVKLPPNATTCGVSFDGQQFEIFQVGDTLKIKKADCKLQLIQFKDSVFFKTLRNKLGWGGKPGENWKDRRSNRGCRY